MTRETPPAKMPAKMPVKIPVKMPVKIPAKTPVKTAVRTLQILITAVEPSADFMGARLMEAIAAQYGGAVKFFGCGGVEMRRRGLYSAFPVTALAVIGLSDIMRVYRRGQRYAQLIGELAGRIKPDIVICIDAWLFSKAVAKQIKDISPETVRVKYAAPQIWASRPGRVRDVKACYDLVLSLFPMDLPHFETINMPAFFVGNPNFETAARARKDEPAFRRKYGFEGKRLVTLLPGSRKSEIDSLGPLFGVVAHRLATDHPDLVFCAPVAPGMEPVLAASIRKWRIPCRLIPAGERFSLFTTAEIALAASGTASTELAICQTPMVIAYKTSFVSYILARAIARVKYVSILNILADAEIIPEYLQDDCTADRIYMAMSALLTDKNHQEGQRAAFAKWLPELGIGPAADEILSSASLSARYILEFYQSARAPVETARIQAR